MDSLQAQIDAFCELWATLHQDGHEVAVIADEWGATP